MLLSSALLQSVPAIREENYPLIGFIIFITPAIILSLVCLYYYFHYRDIQLRKLRAYARPFPEKYREILTHYFLYYRQLPLERKHAFEKRVQKILLNKTFVPVQMSAVTDEMRVLIAAALAQLTFGLPEIYFRHFHTIRIHPTRFASGYTGRDHLGEVNPRGTISLSWEHFVKGYINTSDGYNLALHELAHALRIENVIENGEHDFLDRMALRVVNRISAKKLQKIRENTDSGFLRRYAGTDPAEFFAVSIESFFERPREMKEQLPELYEALVKLLGQDPLLLLKQGV